MNRRIPNGTYGGVRGRGLAAPSYSILDPKKMKYVILEILIKMLLLTNYHKVFIPDQKLIAYALNPNH
jgi:hypothetical protein